MEIRHDTETHRFLVTIDDAEAHVEYSLHDGALDILHTIVPKQLEGQGIAGAMVKEAYDYALSNSLTPVATCSYARVWLLRHPDYIKK